MDVFRLCLALGPVGVYLLMLGAINMSRRPLLVSGGRDLATLALAISGLIVIGPIELFFPYQAENQFGAHVWWLLIGLYVMCVVLLLLIVRPRLIIYNISIDKLRPILAELVDRLDPGARWAGDTLALPKLGVQLFVDSFAGMRTVSLLSAGGNQNHQGWRRLEAALAESLAREEVTRNPRGLSLIGVGLLILAVLVMAISRDPQAITQSLTDIAHSLLEMAGF